SGDVRGQNHGRRRRSYASRGEPKERHQVAVDAGTVQVPAVTGDTHRPDPQELQLGVLEAVTLHLLDCDVIVAPVQFEHDALLRPPAVDLPAADVHVALGL